MSELPTITAEGDWLDLRVGERAIAIGKLEIGGFRLPTFKKSDQGTGTLIVKFTDWSSLLVRVPDARQRAHIRHLEFKFAKVLVERTEDGVDGVAIWPAEGGVAVPLVDVSNRQVT